MLPSGLAPARAWCRCGFRLGSGFVVVSSSETSSASPSKVQ